MKLPFDFGIKLLFRLLIPGVIVALGLLPIVNTILAWCGWTDKFPYVFPSLAVLIGWLFLVADMHVYMFFEGRRYWPSFLLTYFYSREKKRLARIQKAIDDYHQLEESSSIPPSNEEYQLYVENYVERRNFMMNDSGEFEVKRPSRLGNLIKAYEDYPYRVYRMDAVFYWPRLWLKLPKEVREESDNQQAVADSTLYTAFALFFNGFLWFLYALSSSIQALFINYTGVRLSYGKGVFDHLPYWVISWLLVLAFTILSYCVYRMSVHIHTTYGDLFKSLFDNYQKEINVISIIEDVSNIAGSAAILNLNRKEQLEVVRNYLEYGLIECLACNEYIKAHALKTHMCRSANDQN